MQFKVKLISHTWANDKKANFGPDFGLFWPIFGPRIFFLGRGGGVLPLTDVKSSRKISLYVISRRTNESNSKK